MQAGRHVCFWGKGAEHGGLLRTYAVAHAFWLWHPSRLLRFHRKGFGLDMDCVRVHSFWQIE